MALPGRNRNLLAGNDEHEPLEASVEPADWDAAGLGGQGREHRMRLRKLRDMPRKVLVRMDEPRSRMGRVEGHARGFDLGRNAAPPSGPRPRSARSRSGRARSAGNPRAAGPRHSRGARSARCAQARATSGSASFAKRRQPRASARCCGAGRPASAGKISIVHLSAISASTRRDGQISLMTSASGIRAGRSGLWARDFRSISYTIVTRRCVLHLWSLHAYSYRET